MGLPLAMFAFVAYYPHWSALFVLLGVVLFLCTVRIGEAVLRLLDRLIGIKD